MKKLILMIVVFCSLNTMAMDVEVKVKVKVIDLIEEECTYSDYLNPKICVEMISQCFDAIFHRRDLVPNRTLSQKATEAFYECSSIEQ